MNIIDELVPSELEGAMVQLLAFFLPRDDTCHLTVESELKHVRRRI